jgi:hypothetical protein
LHTGSDALLAQSATAELWKAARNLVVAFRSFDRPRGLDGVMLASVEGTPLHAMLDHLGKRGKARVGKRELDRWINPNPKEPWLVATPAIDVRHTIYGYVMGGESTLAWWWGQPSPAASGGPTPFVALVRADLPWIAGVIEKLGDQDGLAELATGLGAARGLLTLVPGGELAATVAIDVT